MEDAPDENVPPAPSPPPPALPPDEPLPPPEIVCPEFEARGVNIDALAPGFHVFDPEPCEPVVPLPSPEAPSIVGAGEPFVFATLEGYEEWILPRPGGGVLVWENKRSPDEPNWPDVWDTAVAAYDEQGNRQWEFHPTCPRIHAYAQTEDGASYVLISNPSPPDVLGAFMVVRLDREGRRTGHVRFDMRRGTQLASFGGGALILGRGDWRDRRERRELIGMCADLRVRWVLKRETTYDFHFREEGVWMHVYGAAYLLDPDGRSVRTIREITIPGTYKPIVEFNRFWVRDSRNGHDLVLSEEHGMKRYFYVDPFGESFLAHHERANQHHATWISPSGVWWFNSPDAGLARFDPLEPTWLGARLPLAGHVLSRPENVGASNVADDDSFLLAIAEPLEDELPPGEKWILERVSLARFSADGELLWKRPILDARFPRIGVAPTPSGRVYLSNFESQTIWALDTDFVSSSF
jgi:hypothetical protein